MEIGVRAHPGGLCAWVQSPSSCQIAVRSNGLTLRRHEVMKAFLHSQAHCTHCGTCSPNSRCCLECKPRSPWGKVDAVMPGHGGGVVVDHPLLQMVGESWALQMHIL